MIIRIVSCYIRIDYDIKILYEHFIIFNTKPYLFSDTKVKIVKHEKELSFKSERASEGSVNTLAVYHFQSWKASTASFQLQEILWMSRS